MIIINCHISQQTTPNGVSNCKAYHHWTKWQEFVEQQKEDPAFPPELESLFQTSDRLAGY